MHKDKLPDSLRPGLAVVFVGTAAGKISAATGNYYAKPGNRFWAALHEAGITPRRYQPREWRDLLALGIGFTDLVKSEAGMDGEVDFTKADRTRFEKAMRDHRPRVVAMTSKRSASVWLQCPTRNVDYGLQKPLPDFPAVLVLPSPSGAAAGHWDIDPWMGLTRAMGR